MGGNHSLIADDIDGFDSVQKSPPRRPEFYFFNQPKKLHALPIVALGRLFNFFLISHNANFRRMNSLK